MTAEYFPEQTIRYKTYVKNTMVGALNAMFSRHPDTLLQRTRATIEFPRHEVDFPSVVVRFFERTIFNAGVGHTELAYTNGESDSIEVSAIVPDGGGSVQLAWPPVANAVGYNVYVGGVSNQEDQVFPVTSTAFIDNGSSGGAATVPTVVTAALDPPQPEAVIGPPGELPSGPRYYRVTAIAPSQAVTYQHYFYSADLEFVVYALSSYDRDLIADTVVQTLAMGSLADYTNAFFDRVYPANALYPDSFLHFININADLIQGFGENQTQTPWGAEDDLLYTTSYRVGLFGELYSLPPKLTYSMVTKIVLYPLVQGFDTLPPSVSADGIKWVSNSP